RVAHDDGNAGAQDTRSGQAAVRDNKGCEAEISLGLAAARRKEQQVGNLTVAMFAIGQPRDVEQDEGQLKWSPFGGTLRRRIACRSGIAAPSSHRDREIHEAECCPRPVVARENVDSLDDSLARALHFDDEPLRGFPTPRGETLNFLSL